MSGHNRWSKIKRYKEAQGASKGKLFTKLIKEVTVSARIGGGDPAGNARLRAAIDLAKDANMPSENIVRAVKKGTGELEGVDYEEAVYEGYGPGGVAMIVECLTDNRHRTAGDVRSSFTKGGGNLAVEGAVSWMFEKRGVIEVKAGPTEDQVMEAAIEAGADDVVNRGLRGPHPAERPAPGGRGAREDLQARWPPPDLRAEGHRQDTRPRQGEEHAPARGPPRGPGRCAERARRLRDRGPPSRRAGMSEGESETDRPQSR
jgi:YebC/PmpR family DNA-binding regulatory protein